MMTSFLVHLLAPLTVLVVAAASGLLGQSAHSLLNLCILEVCSLAVAPVLHKASKKKTVSW